MEISQYDLLALMPCPLKVPFDKKLNMYLKGKKEEGISFKCNIDANVNNHEALPNKEVFKQLLEAKSMDDLPEIIFTTGLNSLFFSEFKHRFIGRGNFEEVLGEEHSFYSEYGYRDPNREYTMLTLNPLVMVVNLAKLGEREIPEGWDSLINSQFEDDVVIRGNDNMYCETVMLSLCHDFGLSSMEKFYNNLNKGLHPAEMVKEIITKREKASAIYVMPYFFALKLRNNKNTKIIWPEDGALANPVSMLVKKSARQEVKDMARYITGEEMGQLFTDAAFPVVNSRVDNEAYEDMKVKWIGWKAINNPTLGETVKGLNNYFLRGGSLDDCKMEI